MLKHPTMLSKIIPLAAIIVIFFTGDFAVAKIGFFENSSKEEKEPIHIQSDTAEFQEKTGDVIYRGHVFVTQGDRYLLADELTIHRDLSGKLATVVARGNPATFKTLLGPKKKEVKGEALWMQYNQSDKKITLRETAKLMQEGNLIQGPSITYHLEQGSLSSTPIEGQRTTIILKTKDSP